MVVEQFVHVDGPKKVPVVEQFVVDLKQALHVAELTCCPFTVLQIRTTGKLVVNFY
jgi:hypothetical protein